MAGKIEFEASIRCVDKDADDVFITIVAKQPMGIDLSERYRVTLEPLVSRLKPCPFCGGRHESTN